MWLTRLSISRPIIIWMALTGIAVLGVISYLRLPAELNPRVPIPTITVVTVYPGAGPEEVEDQVTRPIEDAVGTVGGIRNVQSSSQESVSIVGIDFRVGTDLETALSAVRERMDGVRAVIPSDARSPIVAKLDINAQPVIYAALSARSGARTGAAASSGATALRRAAETGLKPRLLRIPGVASVAVSGGDQLEVRVHADARRLGQTGVTIEDVVNAIRGAGRNVPAGVIAQGLTETAVRTAGAFESLEEISSAQILTLGLMASRFVPDIPLPGAPVRSDLPSPVTVADVADVSLGAETPTVISRVDGRPSVALIVTKAADANAIAVADEVRREIGLARGTDIPADTDVAILRDESGVVRDALHDVNTTLVLGAFLAVLVVLFFLRNFRGTVIVAIALPSCVMATYLVIYFAGFTLNQMTLLALSLG
ncbi:MAG: efflux RND transporter permease subunit, partial [Armatimonadetes bacterium]|nr:efflux RND transporter permease subunit [Armatimonadota bacterium]